MALPCTRGGGKKNLTPDQYRSAARHLLQEQSDGVYLFNFFTSREGGAATYEPPIRRLAGRWDLVDGFARLCHFSDQRPH
ncbi:MAG: hypothetical protein ACPGXX_11200 [Planctomycetaceae bacterium]